ncbi:hypothetical protein [Pedobacter sp. B4-66]|uniref:hypothetical protein n=1 Tax=Pedobacter sp. B4-66 TaxID=2817280 RepID=UPI001BDAF2F1|nr:hypothetical protein [Pedobacter sp. B4-66]
MKLKLIIYTTLVFISFSSCKKTMDLPVQSDSKILEYKVPVSDGVISGVIDETDKTITVYVPFYYQLDVIDPEIKLAKGAKLKEEILPVEVLNNTMTYTVTGADKSNSTYKLIIKLQQVTPLLIKELSSETTTASIGIGFQMASFDGNFNTNDANKVRVFLVDATGKESEFSHTTGFGAAAVRPLNGADGKKTYNISYMGVPQTVLPGLYKVRVKVLSLTTEMKYPVKLEYVTPQVDYVTPTVKQGEAFAIKSSGPVFTKFESFSIMVNGEKVELGIEGQTINTANVRIPATVPPGVYAPSIIFEGFPKLTSTFWNITVIAK